MRDLGQGAHAVERRADATAARGVDELRSDDAATLRSADLDRDGQLEAVTAHGHTLESRAETSPLTRHYAFPDLGCGC